MWLSRQKTKGGQRFESRGRIAFLIWMIGKLINDMIEKLSTRQLKNDFFENVSLQLCCSS